ncbi:RiPP maturation radical SAM C-methyltransferase [Allorhizocola rhizosphaerae]|uniref:RiPP maturation radical SAM C-methyltransferase n=1 Tax=Allorhizocola rhizosphaerae TaxID=1872709 RepID=UPI000E3BFA3E|nr:RiPP maturation radical SAM C-methyltransferase [Allorhizocola rhizosphaerae]
MRVSLVSMPWQALHWPSLALSVLDTVLTDLGCEVTQIYGNLQFAEYLAGNHQTGGELSPDDYHIVCDTGFAYGVGEWVFSSALYEPGWRLTRFREHLEHKGYAHADAAERMHRLAPRFVELTADRVLATRPDLVGISSAFEQNVPSLALAAALKRRRPDLPIVMGGANCDGPMGAALHRNFPQLDYVVRGEGERPVRELLEAFAGQRAMADVTGLCWRDADGRAHENPYVARPTPGHLLPVAKVDPFFEAVHASPARPWINGLALRLETSRGCWWGEKRQCTFCGLNGGGIGFRSKPAKRAFDEISSAVAKFGVLDVMLSDNILDPSYFDTLLPWLAALDWDLNIFYEVKSNLKPEQMASLAAAGVTTVQPGIESLSSRVLALMNKGATGAAQVRALRLFREHGIHPMWNYLYGFPGERWLTDYAHVAEQIPALVHLPPPNGITRVTLDRFSPLFDDPTLGVDEPLLPAAWYPLVYDLDGEELLELAYTFEYPPKGIDDNDAAKLAIVVEQWRERSARSSMTCRAVDDVVVIEDRRIGWPARDHVLRGARASAYLALARHLTMPGLLAVLGDQPDLREWLGEWKADGLVYEDAGTWVALAVPGVRDAAA